MKSATSVFERREDPMRVMVLHAPTGIGGAEGVILSMNQHIDPTQVRLFNCPFINFGRGKSLYLEELEMRGISFDAMPLVYRFDYRYVLATRKLISKYSVDIIHTHGYRSDIIALLAARGNIPVVSTVHGFTASTSRVKIYETIQRLFLKRMKAIIPVSLSIEQQIMRLGIPKNKVCRLTNIVDAEALTCLKPSQSFEEMGIGSETFKMVFVGRLSSEKGLDVLLDTCVRLDRDGLPYSLLVVGDGPLRKNYAEFVVRWGLSSKVKFCGFRRDATAIMAAGDVFILPSRTEGIPLVILEAMALGKMVIASRVGGLPQLVVSGESGLLVDPDDAESLATALIWTHQHPREASRMAEHARSYINRHCNPKAWASELTNIYRWVLGCRQNRFDFD